MILTPEQIVQIGTQLNENTYTGNTLADVSSCSETMESLDQELAELETQVKNLKNIRDEVDKYLIPKLLFSVNMTSFKMDNGNEVSYKEQVFASIPKEDLIARDRCFEWLNENGAGSLIKDKLVVTSPTPELIESCRGKFAIDVNRDIHPASLKSFLSEALGVKANSIARLAADEVPQELHLYIENRTTIKRAK